MEIKVVNGKTWTLTCYILSNSMDTEEYGDRPGILVIPGGGYYMCSKREGEPVATAYLAEGFNAFVLEYSVGKDKTFELALEDAKEAFAYICANSRELHTDSKKIAVCGFSAGGHLAAALSTIPENKPAASVLGYPCILEEISSILAFSVPGLDKLVTKQTPPAFITATADDTCVPIENALAYASALNKNNIPFEMHIFSDGPHGFSVAKPHTAGDNQSLYSLILSEWLPMSVDFLNKIFEIHVGENHKF